MDREDARKAFADSGLTFADLTPDSMDKLAWIINVEMKESGVMRGSLRCNLNHNIRRRDGKVTGAEITCRAFYFEDREAVTFGTDGFIGFAGWADETNVAPILKAFTDWISITAKAVA